MSSSSPAIPWRAPERARLSANLSIWFASSIMQEIPLPDVGQTSVCGGLQSARGFFKQKSRNQALPSASGFPAIFSSNIPCALWLDVAAPRKSELLISTIASIDLAGRVTVVGPSRIRLR